MGANRKTMAGISTAAKADRGSAGSTLGPDTGALPNARTRPNPDASPNPDRDRTPGEPRSTSGGRAPEEKPEANSQTPLIDDESIRVEAPPKKKPPAKKPAPKPAAPKRSASEAAEASKALIEMVEVFSIARFGEVGAMTATERNLIEPALARLIERYGHLAESFAAWLDPLVLGIGGIMYAWRLGRMAVKDSEEKAESPAAQAQAPAPAAGNGKDGFSANPTIFEWLGAARP